MVNKVLAAYVVTDLAFAVTGAIMIAFCVIVQNTMFDAPTDGAQAVRNLLYQQFPLTGTLEKRPRRSWEDIMTIFLFDVLKLTV